ncbi:anthranilate phosphoribosyltransferase [Euryhalocaulis caribicus]|uniref:anthranilate phosphoribosyltransferase n=1 Tax=Euryhalocaulis caribicus TaxID=1161401 RepID=UPI0003A5E58A|nr:anthranilate phosphoribosyltransferase [Euryhalocaulis caribicus]
MSAVQRCIGLYADRRRAPAEDVEAALGEIMDGAADHAQIAAFLMGLRILDATVDEIEAGVRVLRSRATRIETPHDIIDTCGTGGDAAGSFNISTAAALIAAGAGARVAKHGNRAVSSKSGSSQVLAELGVNIETDHAVVGRCIDEANVGFLYAPTHHSALKHAAPVRRSLSLRTLFNLLGPLSNPAGAKRQLLGVYDAKWLEPIADALRRTGSTRVWVVHGADGMDELTTTSTTRVAELKDGQIRHFEVTPEAAGLKRSLPDALQGGDPVHNARAIESLLAGERSAYRDIAALNAGAALVIAEIADNLTDGVEMAFASIDEGKARGALDSLIAISNS